jgi:hypothetical protein
MAKLVKLTSPGKNFQLFLIMVLIKGYAVNYTITNSVYCTKEFIIIDYVSDYYSLLRLSCIQTR